MKGICLDEERRLTMREFPLPEVTAEMVQIRPRYAGICGTDIGYWKNGSSKLRLPVILGHEMSGTVEKVGEDVTDFKVGDRVIVTNEYHICGKCRYCRTGRINMCIERRTIGSAEHGAFAEHMVVPARMVLHLPDELSFEEGTLAEVTACGIHALRTQAGVQAGDVVLVMGPGIMGMTAALSAKALGATVVIAGLDRDEERLQKARELGIPYTVNCDKTDLKELVLSLTNGYGADACAECTGSFGGLSVCMDLAARCASVVQIAIPRGAHGIDLSPIIMKELNYCGSYAKRMPDWLLTLEMMKEGKLPVSKLVSAVYSPDNYLEAFERAAEVKNNKILFDMERF